MRSPPSSPSPPSVFGTLGRALADLVLPAECAVCAAPGHRLCPACAEGLTAVLSRPFRAEQDAP
ncbi:MAG: ComF family protein, partial [Micrococcus luteus]